jgi:hypothetical protein
VSPTSRKNAALPCFKAVCMPVQPVLASTLDLLYCKTSEFNDCWRSIASCGGLAGVPASSAVGAGAVALGRWRPTP